jgi:hypothetical protein
MADQQEKVWLLLQRGGEGLGVAVRGIFGSYEGCQSAIAAIRVEHPDLPRSEFMVWIDVVRGKVQPPPPEVERVIAPAVERRIRAYLWLTHGHTGQYGDDGEMQCRACVKFGAWDYKRTPLATLLDVVQAVADERVVRALSGAGRQEE